MSLETRIRLFGNDYVLVGDLETGGAISTVEQLENFECSFAHLKSNGDIMRFQTKIGTRDDIELVGEDVEIKIKADAEKVLESMFDPLEWMRTEREKDVPKGSC